jgi:SAM-dependent methyltransferase
MDAEKLEFPDSSFDLLTCSFGIMFFPDARKAGREAFRVLKPGGRAGFIVWSTPERFPMFACAAAAFIRRLAPLPVRLLVKVPWAGHRVLRRLLVSKSPAGFSPARFSEPGSLETLLAATGFSRVRRELRAFPLEFDSFDDYWRAVFEATPSGGVLTRQPEPVLAEIRQELRTAMVNPKTGRIHMFNEAALILADKPA